MKKGKSGKAASKQPVRTGARRTGAKKKMPKMMNLSAALSAGDLAIGVKLFKPEELETHGNPVEKTFHSIRVVPPLPGWLLVSSRHCVTGTVHRADGPAAGDGDTNFELCFPKTDPVTGELGGQAKAIDAKIDRQNAELTGEAVQLDKNGKPVFDPKHDRLFPEELITSDVEFVVLVVVGIDPSKAPPDPNKKPAPTPQ